MANESGVLIIDDDSIRIDRICRWYGIKPWLAEYSEHFDVTLIEQADVVFLDHDLGYTDVYNELRKANLENVSRDTIFYVHSMNPVGARNIANLLTSQGFSVKIRPFSAMSVSPNS